jgi:hypothetical protein
MIEDKISIILKDLAKLKDGLKDAKKDMRKMERVDRDDFREIERGLKDMKKQLSDIKDEWEAELCEDDFYNELRELKMEAEEKIAKSNADLFEALEKCPQKPFTLQVETEEGSLRVQVQPEMKIYVNGKEEKKRLA